MFTYGLQFADKQSLSSGVLFGLRQDTHLVGNEYANLTTLFYMAYGVAQFPMSWFIQRFPLGKALSICIILWGACVMALAGCNNYAQLAATRVFLGVFESAIIPGFAILTSSWYLRKEQTLRQCCYYSMNTIFGILTGVCLYYLADYVTKTGGMAAWRVINLFLGSLTVAVGIVDFFFIGTPDEVWWLSKREKDMAHCRIVSNASEWRSRATDWVLTDSSFFFPAGGGEKEPWKWSQVKECFTDPQYYFFVLFNILVCIPNGGLTTFGSLIYIALGFTALESILYGMPSQAIGFVFVIVPAICVAFYPKTRFFWAIFSTMVACAAFLFTGLAPDTVAHWTKWGVYVLTSVFATAMFMVWPLMSINVAGRTKKAWLSATSLVTYCAGNIIGSQIFVTSDAPKYLKGLTGCAIAMMINVVLMLGWVAYYVWENRRRDRAFAASGMSTDEQAYQSKLAGETDMTDRDNKHFRYVF